MDDDKLDLAYLAGLFDGDGCINIKKTTNSNYKRGVSYHLMIRVAQKFPAILEDYKARWGGEIYEKTTKGRCVNEWQAYSNEAARCLEELLPYLRLKKEEAKAAIRFQDTRNSRGNRRGQALSNEEFAYDESVYFLLKQLKQERK